MSGLIFALLRAVSGLPRRSSFRAVSHKVFYDRDARQRVASQGDATTSALSEQLSAARSETAKAATQIVTLERRLADTAAELAKAQGENERLLQTVCFWRAGEACLL